MGAALALSGLGLLLNLATFVTNAQRPAVIVALACACIANVLLGVLWRRAKTADRLVLCVLFAANLWVIADAGGRRLPSLL